MMTHPTDLLESYALGALEPNEAADVARHVQECATCQQRLRDIDRTLGLLATLAPETSPPDGAEDRLFARIAELRQSSPFERRPTPASLSTLTESRQAIDPIARLRRLPGLGARRAVYGLAALAAVLLLAVGLLAGQLHAAQTTNATLTAQLAQQQRAMSVLSSPNAVVRHLVATDTMARGATGTMVMDPAKKDGVFIVSQLPQLPSGKTYEFWLVQASPGSSEGEAIPTGTFEVDSTGQALVAFNTDISVSQLSNAGVSVEAAGGARHPDSPMIMLIAS
jgi:anti-sigma factor RsiW